MSMPAANPRLEALAAQYHTPLLRFFQRRLRGGADADDLVQEVFIRLARQEDLEAVDHLDGYVFQIAANVLRDRARRLAVRAEPPTPPAFDAIDEAGFSPERVLLGREALERMIAALYELPEKTRMVFSQYHFDGTAQVEIARRLGMSVSTVEKHMARANAHLLRRLRDRR
jgi:RNA polymerase sigma factor (sigma-70 family)